MTEYSDFLVSVIIPIHNRFDLVNEAINTVYKQTYRPIEIIIVDDKSSNLFNPIIGSEPDFLVNFIRNDENIGPGESRERGRELATGNFICYLDSDDLWHEQKVEKQVQALHQNPHAGMCYCTSSEFSKTPITGLEIIRRRSGKSFEEFLPTIFEGRPWDTSACIWTRSASEKIGPWSSSWAWEDYEYDCRAGCNNIRIVHLNEVLCYYRTDHGETQLSKENGKFRITQRAASLIEMERNLRKFDKFGDHTIRNRMSQMLYFQALNLLYEKDKGTGRELIEKSAKLSNGYRGFTVLLLVRLLSIFPARFLYQIFYRIRKYLI